METSFGNALAKAAIGWKMTSLKAQIPTSSEVVLVMSPLFSLVRKLLRVQRRGTPSPYRKASSTSKQAEDYLDNFLTRSVSKASIASLSFSPYKTPKGFSTYSLDLTRTNRSQSTYRMETDRVNRLSKYCESLELKAAWVVHREKKEAERKEKRLEREKEMKHEIGLERSFQEQIQTKKRQDRVEDRKRKEQDRETMKEIKARKMREEAQRVKDDLERSVSARQLEAHRLAQFSKSLAAETRKRDKEDKQRERKEFLVALKRSTEARRIVPEHHDPEQDLAFKLQQAVLKNQEIVSRIVANTHLPL